MNRYKFTIYDLRFTICALFMPFIVFSQNDSLHKSMDELYQQSNSKLITLEMADNLLKDARSFSINELNDEQGDKLMKVYRTIADAYAANYRFKPAYLVYDEYIRIKNSFIEQKKRQRLQKIEIETNRIKDDNTLNISANESQIANLQSENDSLVSAKHNVYTAIWILVIIVAFGSGAVTWYINNKYTKTKHELENNRNRMMTIASISSLGEFRHANGNGSSWLAGIEQLKSDIDKLSDTLNSESKAAKGLSSLLSKLKDAISKL